MFHKDEQLVAELRHFARTWRDESPRTCELLERAALRLLELANRRGTDQPAEPGSVTVVTNDGGECVAVTRTDGEHRILKMIWKSDMTDVSEEVEK